jgi:hypothetical protein
MRRSKPLEATTPLERRKPLARGKGLKRSGRVKPRRSTPRRGRLTLTGSDRQELRHATYDRAGGQCEAGIAPGCPGRVDRERFEWHHRKLRSQGGDDVPENSLCVCRSCHEWIHRHPQVAQASGWIVPSFAAPEHRAVNLPDGRIVRLTSDNEYDEVFPAEMEGGAA